MNVGMMDLLVIQHCSVGVWMYDNDAWRMLMWDLNICSCVKLLEMLVRAVT